MYERRHVGGRAIEEKTRRVLNGRRIEEGLVTLGGGRVYIHYK